MGIKFTNSEFSFSIFKNLFSSEKYQDDIDVNQLIELIKYGAFRKEIGDLRSTGSKADYNRIKKEDLPAVTLSGSFNKRSREGLIKHSGLIQIDIDKVEHYDDLFQKLCNDIFTYLCFRSPGGKGIKVVVKINPSAGTHLDQFRALEKYYKDQYATEIDKACKDVARCMLISWDPDLFCNPYSDVFAEMFVEEKRKYSKPERIPFNQESLVKDDSLNDTVESIISALERGKIDLTAEFSDWIKIGYALCSSFGENGRRYFYRISSMYTDYSFDEADKKYTQLLASNNGRVGIGTLIWLARNHGIETTRSQQATPKTYEYTENLTIAAEEKARYKSAALKKSFEEEKSSITAEELRVNLKKLRQELAKKKNIAAFRVFYDSTLEALIEAKPQTVNDLYNIKGLGDKKIKWFGRDLIELITIHIQDKR